jgi:hypothetical protein
MADRRRRESHSSLVLLTATGPHVYHHTIDQYSISVTQSLRSIQYLSHSAPTRDQVPPPCLRGEQGPAAPQGRAPSRWRPYYTYTRRRSSHTMGLRNAQVLRTPRICQPSAPSAATHNLLRLRRKIFGEGFVSQLLAP